MTNPNTFLSGAGVPGLVSIIIPCYNRGDIVGETIESVLAQTYTNFEMLLIDDGSTDDTRAAILAYDDPRIRYFYKLNGGLSSARNAGLEEARGEFIAFLDSDDVWQNWKLGAQLAIFRRHPEAGLIWSDMSTFTNAGEVLAERHLRDYYSAYGVVNFESAHKRSGTLSDLVAGSPTNLGSSPYYVADVFHDMFSGNLVHPSTAIVRRERLRQSGPFEPEITGLGAEDYHFYFRICSHGPAAFLDAPTTLYRVHPLQLSQCNRLHEARGNLNVVMHWLHTRPPTLPQLVIHRSLAGSHAWLGEEELNAGNSRVATHHLWQSLCLHTKQPATIFLLLVSLVPRRAALALRAMKRAVRGLVAAPLGCILIRVSDDQSVLFQLADFVQSVVA